MEMIKTERVSRDRLRAIKPGESVCFSLPDNKACESARTSASQLKAVEKINFSVSINYVDSMVTITRR